jgi:uncharacterized protein YdbL (DUF1318 family)
MATIGLDSGTGYREQGIGGLDILQRRAIFPVIRWGAVVAGVAFGISVQLVLTLLGIASGLSAMDVTRAEGVGNAPLLWTAGSMLIAALAGGYVTARMSGLKRKADGALHGAISWAVTTLLFALLATSAGGTLLGGIFSNMDSAMARASTGGESVVGTMLRGQIGRNVDATTLQTLQQAIQAGRREEAVQIMQSMGVDPARAGTIADQALILSGSPTQASPQGRETANRVVETASMAAWGVFGTVALTLVLGVIGGMLGAAGSRRTVWTGTAAPGPAAARTTATTTTTTTSKPA